MKIFLSWSGLRSKKIAELFKGLLSKTNQQAKLFFSPQDILTGTVWLNKLLTELKDSDHGIFFITRENLDSPYMHFEGGAILKEAGENKLAAIQFGVETSEVKGPFSNFQMSFLDNDSIFKLINELNEEHENPVEKATLREIFDKFYPEVKESIIAIIEEDLKEPKKIPTSESLNEIVASTRSIDRRLEEYSQKVHTLAFHLSEEGKALRRAAYANYHNPEDEFRFKFHLEQLKKIVTNLKNARAPKEEIERFIAAIPEIRVRDEISRMHLGGNI